MALIKCPECGQLMSDKAPACPNCRRPQTAGGGNTPPSADGGTGMLMAGIVVAIVVVLGLIITVLASRGGEAGRESSWQQEEPVQPAATWNTTDDVRTAIEGTLWTYTEIIGDDDNYDRWCRLEFRDGWLLFYEVSPSKGEWGEPRVCEYEVEETRYSNTGERFIRIIWHTPLMNYSFVPETRALYWQSSSGYKLGAYLKRGDSSPWN